jgi:NADH:ubiquinone oxidoreductase subunit 6 (subunit J)
VLSLYVFVFLIMVGFFFSVELFLEKELFKSALSLAIVFMSSAGLILLLGQPLVALFQLLILVGGLSTYLMVAVASSRHAEFIHSNMLVFMIAFIVLDVVFIYGVALQQYPGSLIAPQISQSVTLAIAQYYALIYAMVFLIFSVAIGSILLIRKVVKMVV